MQGLVDSLHRRSTNERVESPIRSDKRILGDAAEKEVRKTVRNAGTVPVKREVQNG